MALMVRTRQDVAEGSPEFFEWAKLANGVRNNNPEVFKEIFPSRVSGVERKRAFREAFGRERGDILRLEGGGIGSIGPLTQEIIFAFASKLARSLYYHQTRKVFEGAIYLKHYNMMQIEDPESLLNSLVALTPHTTEIKRSGKSLDEQFFYRYNWSVEESLFVFAVHFQIQFLFHMIAMVGSSWEAFEAAHTPQEVLAYGERTIIKLDDD